MEKEEEKDRLTEIQDRMNGMEVGKRKRALVIFAIIFAAIIIFRFIFALGGFAHDEEKTVEKEKTEETLMDERLKVLEYSLDRKNEKDSRVDQILEDMVKEDRAEKERKNGTK